MSIQAKGNYTLQDAINLLHQTKRKDSKEQDIKNEELGTSGARLKAMKENNAYPEPGEQLIKQLLIELEGNSTHTGYFSCDYF